MTMDKTRSALIRRLQGADRYGRFHAFCPETDAGKTVIVHAKCTIIDDVMLRAGSTNLNNRSTGFDTECDVAIEAAEGDATTRARDPSPPLHHDRPFPQPFGRRGAGRGSTAPARSTRRSRRWTPAPCVGCVGLAR